MADAPSTISESGRYRMEFQSEWNDETMSWYILVYDTSSGRSKMYYGNGDMGKIVAAGSAYNIPSSPL